MLSVIKFDKRYDRQAFDCGVPVLNDFLKIGASQYLKRKECVIYYAIDNDNQRIAGFYTLSNTLLTQADDKELLKKHSPHMPISCALIGRLAVDLAYRGRGVGSDLLIHALLTVKELSERIGIAFVVVDAKDDTAKAFYERYGFKALASNPLRLCYAVKNIR